MNIVVLKHLTVTSNRFSVQFIFDFIFHFGFIEMYIWRNSVIFVTIIYILKYLCAVLT